MSGSDEILASAIAGAQYLVDGLPLNIWKGFGIELKFDDPLSLEEVSPYAFNFFNII